MAGKHQIGVMYKTLENSRYELTSSRFIHVLLIMLLICSTNRTILNIESSFEKRLLEKIKITFPRAQKLVRNRTTVL